MTAFCCDNCKEPFCDNCEGDYFPYCSKICKQEAEEEGKNNG